MKKITKRGSGKWQAVYQELVAASASIATDVVYFRGQSNATWRLMPGLGRPKFADPKLIEAVAYYDFVTRAGDLLAKTNGTWEVLLTMQHHGMPTRYLDWTETLGVALYFAVRNATSDSAVWVLDPFKLNEMSWGTDTIPMPSQLDGEYHEFFIDDVKQFPAAVIAATPPRHNPRINRQRGGFTIHRDLQKPLDALYPDTVKKIVIPLSVHEEARAFLRFAGISEFSLFPDLDGLARELCDVHCRPSL